MKFLGYFFSTEYTPQSRRLTRLSQFEKISTTKMAPMLSNFFFLRLYVRVCACMVRPNAFVGIGWI